MPDDRLTTLPLDRIELSRTDAQVARRKRFDAAALSELAESMRQYGVLQPIICRSTATDYELVAGERRYLAAKQAGLAKIPAVVRSLSDAAVIEVQLIENLQRADVHPMEEAEGYQQLMKQHGRPIEELHAKVGKSRSYVYGRLKLLDLCKQARNAFYDGKLSASISLLVARIPGEALQKQALDRVLGGHFWQPMSYRDASDWIQHELMLRLKDAPFPTDDVLLDDQAGPCTTCPKRTGNQPELFGDIQGADVCTDPACHKGKLVAWGERLLEAAEGRGQKVIAGAEAKKVAPRGAAQYQTLNGWHKLDEKNWDVGKTIKQIVGKTAERALLQCPETGLVVEVVSAATVRAALKESGQRATTNDPYKAAQQKQRIERQFRHALYAEIRPTLPPPTPQAIAVTLLKRLWHDAVKVLCTVRGFEAPISKGYGGSKHKDYLAIGKGIESWTDEAAQELINDMLYVSELMVSTHSTSQPKQLLEAAKAAGVDPAAVRRSVSPAKKKTTKKKPAQKKKQAASKKRVARKKAAAR